MEPVIAIENLQKSYGDFRLKDISFSLPAGYIMGLVGPNGAGKTTLIKLILNLVRKEGGSIRLFGLDHDADEVSVRSRIGFVHEVPCFYEHMSLAGLAAMFGSFYASWDGDTFRRLAGEFELPLKKRFRKLSRGMKMKFSIALALSHRADLLLLDEPTSGLDPVFRSEFLDRLQAWIQDEKKAVLFSTQITSDLERVADFITVVSGGRMVLSSSKDQVMETWRMVRGDHRLLEEGRDRFFRGIRRHAFGFEGLTDDAQEARRLFGDGAMIEKASLEEIMFFLYLGGRNV